MIKSRRKPRRVSVARDKKYLAFLRSEGICPICGKSGKLWPIQAAHGPVNGMSSKGSDRDAVPLCMDDHAEEHRIGAKAFWGKHMVRRNVIVEYWNQRYKEAYA